MRVLAEMLCQTKCFFCCSQVSLRSGDGGLIPARNWGSVTHFSVNFVKCQSLGQVLLFVLWCDLQKITSFELLFPVLFCVRQGVQGDLKRQPINPFVTAAKLGESESFLSITERRH